MSGSLRLVPPGTPAGKHDHVDLGLCAPDPQACTTRGASARCSTWRRSRSIRCRALGIEPLTRALNPEKLHALSRAHRTAVKQFLMDGRRVVGVGNIYASESLFRARINPRKPANRVTLAQCRKLVAAIKLTLSAAIRAGGSSLATSSPSTASRAISRTATGSTAGKARPERCRAPVRSIVQGQRSTFFCPRCQR
jgi:formamidopyrimidine-DNA glycosylase